ncbi:hypothetical protein DFH06DRAFT_1152557 [Mycena polygramma]|nr:hypothetical protein DFH06DRAFT_1152557 [Mycena polygramma]
MAESGRAKKENEQNTNAGEFARSSFLPPTAMGRQKPQKRARDSSDYEPTFSKEEKAARRRKAVAAHYHAHPEMREKKKEQRREQRERKKLARRRWDPPKKGLAKNGLATGTSAHEEESVGSALAGTAPFSPTVSEIMGVSWDGGLPRRWEPEEVMASEVLSTLYKASQAQDTGTTATAAWSPLPPSSPPPPSTPESPPRRAGWFDVGPYRKGPRELSPLPPSSPPPPSTPLPRARGTKGGAEREWN